MCPLHSNLVLFKSLVSSSATSSISSFTFQSGSIQMFRINLIKDKFNLLYIPIWFYSNKCFRICKSCITCFTFQSGSIQIALTTITRSYLTVLYIPIWFYSNDQRFTSQLHYHDLYIPIWFYSNDIVQSVHK